MLYFLLRDIQRHLNISFFLKIILYWNIVVYNVVLVSGVQQSDLVIHIHISILFQIIFPGTLLQN